MNLDSFTKSIVADEVPVQASVYLQALWYDAKGNWKKAHALIQDLTDANAAWIHAYLHRKEGDLWNADYWYRNAGRKRPTLSLDEEWQQLAHTFLDSDS